MTTTPRARRVALCCLAAVALMTAACSSTDTTAGTAAETTAGPVGDPVAAEAAEVPSWLFTLTATAGRFSTDADGVSTLSLTGIDDHFTAFTDRPDREASIISAEQFVQSWPSMFADSAPNAVLVEHEPSGESDSFVVTLSEPELDADTLSFTVEIVDGEDHSDQIPGLTATPHSEPPASFTTVSLFIDDVVGSSTQTGNCSARPGPHVDMNGCDLSNEDLMSANLVGANLSNANLTGAYLTEANVQYTNLQGANLTDANLQKTNLQYANLTGANLTGAYMINTALSFANLTDVNLQGANLQGAYMINADLKNRNLTNANLQGTVLQAANLTGSDLTGSDLTGANLQNAILNGANLTGATWRNTTCPNNVVQSTPCPHAP